MTPRPKIPAGWRRLRLLDQPKRKDRFWCVELKKWLTILGDASLPVGLNETIIRRITKKKGRK